MSAFGGGKLIQDSLVWCMDYDDKQSWTSGSTFWIDKASNYLFEVTSSHSSSGLYDENDRPIFDATWPCTIFGNTYVSQAQNNWTLQFVWRRDGAAGLGTGGANAYHQVLSNINGSFRIIINNSNNQILVWGSRGGSKYAWSISRTQDYGTYRHISISMDENEGVKMYENGTIRIEDENAADYTGSIDNATTATYIGRQDAYVPNGALPQILFYERVLTDDEIEKNYLSVRGRFGI